MKVSRTSGAICRIVVIGVIFSGFVIVDGSIIIVEDAKGNIF